ncbi:hypothetical protein AJ78_08836 [Emergomyces pasteurianus Ep9510]|uniref:Uncharacterized protein n=1 Tax=Emergomyces pasteurianus Ep9510 TaxID=1447872 RepID=A0A1J9Q456_9EURO|nr:hypothetical protein AJ78_08836 [Emergomyces pasteurianus Ep9510]
MGETFGEAVDTGHLLPSQAPLPSHATVPPRFGYNEGSQLSNSKRTNWSDLFCSHSISKVGSFPHPPSKKDQPTTVKLLITTMRDAEAAAADVIGTEVYQRWHAQNRITQKGFCLVYERQTPIVALMRSGDLERC